MAGVILFFFTTCAFADSLFIEKDYFRAITEYKRLLFYGTTDSARTLDKISQCYALSGKYEKAAEFLSLAMQNSMDDIIPEEWSFRLSWYLYKTKKPEQARIVLEDVNSNLGKQMVGLFYLCEGKTKEARLYLEKRYKIYDENKISFISTFFPGGGQIISGSFIEGIFTSMLIGGLGYLSYKSLAKKDYFNFIFIGSWFLRFYRGNIDRTKQIVRKKNYKLRQQLEKEIQFRNKFD